MVFIINKPCFLWHIIVCEVTQYQSFSCSVIMLWRASEIYLFLFIKRSLGKVSKQKLIIFMEFSMEGYPLPWAAILKSTKPHGFAHYVCVWEWEEGGV